MGTFKIKTMKHILPFLLPIILLTYSCSKPNDSIQNDTEPVIPNWVGEYHSTSGDSAFVSQNGTYCKIEWSPIGVGHRLIFDSVRVSGDLTFTDNEITQNYTYNLSPPFYEDVTAIGSGRFSSNKIDFQIIVYGSGHINFSGIKKN